MEPPISADDAIDFLFEEAALALQNLFKYSRTDAEKLARDYYRLFTDSAYCASIGIPMQDEEFFHHEGAFYVGLRAHYYLGLKADPNPHQFHDWCVSYERSLIDAGQVNEYGKIKWRS